MNSAESVPSEPMVLDASALVDMLIVGAAASAVKQRLAATTLHAPAHLDAEVLSALGRLCRAGSLNEADVSAALERVAALPVTRHLVSDVSAGAWERRGDLRLVDALYVELADQLHTRVIITDATLARATDLAELVSPES